MFQENKARQIFRKMNISYPLIGTRTYQGVRSVRFSENLAWFVFLKHLFEIPAFALLPTTETIILADKNDSLWISEQYPSRHLPVQC